MRKRWPAPLISVGLAAACGFGMLWVMGAHSAHGEEARDVSSGLERGDDRLPSASHPETGARPPARPPTSGLVDQRAILGRSVRGRPIRAEEMGNPASQRRLLVVGCIHGNECAGIAIARALAAEPSPPNADVSIVFDLNPDGRALRTRQNARGVDLNRNFPFRWRPIGAPGAEFYSGTRAGSEPETRVAIRFIDALRPTISIWFHQHLDVVDLSGGSASVERRYARMVGLQARRLPRYPGSVTTWQNHVFPGTSAFVVELPRFLPPRAAERYADAALALVGSWREPMLRSGGARRVGAARQSGVTRRSARTGTTDMPPAAS
jgi:protein MpaA